MWYWLAFPLIASRDVVGNHWQNSTVDLFCRLLFQLYLPALRAILPPENASAYTLPNLSLVLLPHMACAIWVYTQAMHGALQGNPQILSSHFFQRLSLMSDTAS